MLISPFLYHVDFLYSLILCGYLDVFMLFSVGLEMHKNTDDMYKRLCRINDEGSAKVALPVF